MELELVRTYGKAGTNGTLKWVVCHTIELPWLNNQRNVSCIPEGRYQLKKGMTQKHGLHIRVKSVAGRDGILFHPGNEAARDLKGCIAPVTVLTGPGKGIRSRWANSKLNALVLQALERKEEVFLTIKSNTHETT
jgi:hypothetical protein